ncbi:PLD nuclease N-terminal domain-containing protein [Lacinutrix algicola]|uniref:PLD nuclease N-terminal domain-containing protein n=1 Tax=Lacinutrix algicola TaxID=342954 RepID=UPI0006E16A02|nr:PLD nuclease N-terminal domain-containing protein [Lacinutrix algicola]
MNLVVLHSPIGTFQVIILFVALLSFVLFFLAFISVILNKFKGNDKLMWVLVILLVPFFGPIVYFAIGRKGRIKRA